MISPVWGDEFVRSFDPTFEPKEIRRLEVITGVGGRRAWSDEDKGRIVAESFAAGANVSAVTAIACGPGRRSERGLVGPDHRRPAQEAHRPHRDPRGDRRYRYRCREIVLLIHWM